MKLKMTGELMGKAKNKTCKQQEHLKTFTNASRHTLLTGASTGTRTNQRTLRRCYWLRRSHCQRQRRAWVGPARHAPKRTRRVAHPLRSRYHW